MPGHSTLSRRAGMLAVPGLRSGTVPVHLLVDSTGLQPCGSGEELEERHGARTRRAWRKRHIGVDVDTGQILATTLTTEGVVDASQVRPLLDQVRSRRTAPRTRTMSMRCAHAPIGVGRPGWASQPVRWTACLSLEALPASKLHERGR